MQNLCPCLYYIRRQKNPNRVYQESYSGNVVMESLPNLIGQRSGEHAITLINIAPSLIYELPSRGVKLLVSDMGSCHFTVIVSFIFT